MDLQAVLALAAAAASALYFLGGALRELRMAGRPDVPGCSGCPSGGCPAARKG